MLSLSSRFLIRRFSLSSLRNLKEVVESTSTDGKTITIEGKYLQPETSKNKTLAIPGPNGDACPLCRLGVKISYQDVLILVQFMRADGTVLPANVTGLCRKQQLRVERSVQQAHWAGLFPEHKPKSFVATEEFSGYKQFNRYFEKDTDIFRSKIEERPGSFYFVRRYF